MFTASFKELNHRRWDPLRQEWVIVSPKRVGRPWSGIVEKDPLERPPSYDPECYLCPGNIRAGGAVNPRYRQVFCFDNDFAALSSEVGELTGVSALDGIIQLKPASGRCRVVCFSPRHDLTLAELEPSAIRQVIDVWEEEYKFLSEVPGIQHVMTFENKGSLMGCSNPHPHGQIWATGFIPNFPLRALQAQEDYFARHKRRLLLDYLDWELREQERIVCSNEYWVVLVPFWAVWPFEVLVLPRLAVQTIGELNAAQRESWAAILKEITVRYDNLFETSFPYSMGIYQQPNDGRAWSGFQLRQVFFPPLLRSATVRKFMVGFELCAEPQRDLTPEEAAEKLRAVSQVHYKERRI